MTDDRPRPQYGEYATPEQQAEAMGHKYVPPAPEPTTPAPDTTVAPAYLNRQPGYANRFLTVFLLAIGALSLFSNVPAYLSLASTLRTAMAASGTSSASVPSSVNTAGVPILIANVVIYVATLLFSVVMMRRGRTSGYIPVVGFLLFVLVAAILLALYAPSFVTQLGT
ncbi:MAG TPA: DUF6264 family protein [Galbitalea sp.]|jgi:hypothetical protein|nr:DUF6264 family protein [Galbitalea sp.]